MRRQKVLSIALAYTKTLIGAVIYAFGFQYFTYQNAIVSGGVSGVAMIINYLTEFPVGILIIIINVPLFIIAWRRLGLGFMIASLAGMALSSAAIDIFALFPLHITSELMLAAVYGGVVMGFGLGLVYSAGATTGGVDIIAKLMRMNRPYINMGTLILGLDIVVIVAFALIFRRYDSAMYAIISMYIHAKVIDLVLYGTSISKMCYIISEESERLKTAIVEQMERGVTLLKGSGAWSGREKQVILCVIKRQQIVELRRIVRSIDTKAFLIVTEARDVFGEGFEDINDNG